MRTLAVLAGLWLAAGAWVAWSSLAGTPVKPALPFVEVAPRLSGDGRTLAFEAVRGSLRQGRVFGRRDGFAGADRFTDVLVYDLETGTAQVATAGANGSSHSPDLSHDGSLLAFASEASNLVPGDGNAVSDVFVLRDGRLALLPPPSPRGGLSSSFAPAVSGRLVAFATSGLARKQRWRDRALVVVGLPDGAARQVPEQGPPNGPVFGRPAFSPDGSALAFSSFANLEEDGVWTNGIDVFLATEGEPLRLSVAPDGRRGDGPSYSPSLARAWCAFTSLASNLVEGDGNGRYDVFVRDLERGVTVRETAGADSSFEPSLSADGRWLAYTSYVDGVSQVFLKDRETGDVRPITRGTAPSYAPSLSADGSRLAFATRATDLEEAPVLSGQVYVWERGRGLERVRLP